MRIKRSILTPLAIALIGLATGGWFLQRGASPGQNVYMQARLFEEVLHRVSSQFVEEKDPAQLYRMAIDGLLEELGDPHTAFLTPKDYEDLAIQTQGEYGGVGMQIAKRDNWITVIAPLPGTPADRAGLRAGDRIIEIDGASTRDWNEDEAVAKLRGPKGQPVDIRVFRVGVDEPIPFRLVRDEIHVNSILSAQMVAPTVGYIDLRSFAETSTSELREAVAKLQAQGMKGLVLDLRFNPGGLLDQGISVSDLFLERGDVVAETKSRAPGYSQKFTARSADEYPTLPVIVLVGPFSASASEILAGALQDHDRALVIGQTTFGKGSVQTLYELSGGNYLKLTTGRWYTPAGRTIQKPFDVEDPALVVQEPSATELDEVHTAETPASELETFRTDAGRVVYGGGGIRPDVIIEPDTATTGEREFARALEKFGSEFQGAVYTWAVEYVHDNPNLRPDFEVSPAMLDSFHRALRERGIDVDREVYAGARAAIATRLGVEIAQVKWGEQGRRRRATPEDDQLQAAIQVLQQATTPSSVFAIAERLKQQQRQVGAARPGGNQ